MFIRRPVGYWPNKETISDGGDDGDDDVDTQDEAMLATIIRPEAVH